MDKLVLCGLRCLYCFKKLFIYLAVPGLSCSMEDCFLFFCFFKLSMQTLSCSLWNPVPWPGVEPGPPALAAQSRVLVTGPPGKSPWVVLCWSQCLESFTWAPGELPTDISPFQTSKTTGLTLGVLIMISRWLAVITNREIWWKRKCITYNDWGIRGALSEVMDWERRVCLGLGFFYWSWEWGSKVSQA